MYRHFPIYLQDDERSCGVYCLKMILKYHGFDEDIVHLKRLAHVDRTGTTIKGLMATLLACHCEAKAYHCPIDQLVTLPFPCILHLIKDDYAHFVVLYDMTNDGWIIGDPALGLSTYDYDELASCYTGHLIAIYHVGRHNHHDRTFSQCLKKIYRQCYRDIVRMALYGLIISVLSYGLSLMYGLLIDNLTHKVAHAMIIIGVCAYGGMQLFNHVLHYLKQKSVVYMTRCLNKRYIYEAVKGLCFQNETAIDEEPGRLQSQILDLYDLTDYCTTFFSTLLVSGIMVIVLHAGIVLISPLMALLSLSGCLLISVVIACLSKRLLESYKQALKIHNQHSQSLLSLITHHDRGLIFKGYRYIKAYEEDYEADEEAVMTYRTAMNHAQLIDQSVLTIVQWCSLAVSLYLYLKSRLTLGEVFVLLTISDLLMSPLMQLTSLAISYPQATMLFNRMKDFHGIEVNKPVRLTEKVTSISMRHLSYGYGYHEAVFSHFYLTITQNTTIIGANGSGKTTLLKLITGMDDHYRGDLLINGVDVKTIDRRSLSDHILYLGAHDVFFKGSIKDNLLTHDVQAIASVLSLIEAEELTHYLTMPIDEEGTPLSSGQQQLLSFARALLMHKDVYLLDEALCHLNVEHALRIYKRIQTAYPETLFIIVSHQLNGVKITEGCVIIGEDNKEM